MGLTVGSLAAFGMGLYIVQLFISLNREPPSREIPEDLIDRFDKEADGYDEKVNAAEKMLGITSKRRKLTEKVRGHVLEVAVGTGRNFPYYPTKKCDTVTLLDASGPMLAVAKRKWKDEQPEYFHRVFFKQQSALDPITPPFGAQDGYDTVLQTMGICSTSEPVRLLQNLEAATKEDGQILLLEHGRSHYKWLNDLLDKTAPAHADEHGCWWNKDIGKIVEESGLEVVEMKRYNLGTTWWIELKPRKGLRQKVGSGKQIEETAPVTPDPAVVQKPWWNLWR
jgi:methyltransferase OMS1